MPWEQIAPHLTPDVCEQFLAKVAFDPDRPDRCWPWTGAVNQYGYGKFYVPGSSRVNRASITATRIAHYLATGEMDDKRFICHRCDNPTCCNPAHLWLGTHRQNLRDMWQKGRGVSWNKGLKTGSRRKKAA